MPGPTMESVPPYKPRGTPNFDRDADAAPKRGRTQKPKVEKPKKPLMPIGDLRQELENTFALLAAGMMTTGDLYCATIISARSPAAIDAWVALAEINPAWHRLLSNLMKAGKLAAFLNATVALGLPILVHHVAPLRTNPLMVKFATLEPDEQKQYEEMAAMLAAMQSMSEENFMANVMGQMQDDVVEGNVVDDATVSS